MSRTLGTAIGTAAVLCALLGALMTAPRARAQQAQSLSEAEYQRLIAQGVQEFELAHWQEARALFEQAHAQLPTARTLRALGLVEFELRHYARAERYLAAALRDVRRPLPPELREQVEQALERSRGYVGRFELVVEPAGARVSVDGGTESFATPTELTLDTGDHTLRVEHPGYAVHERRLDVRGGQIERLQVTLTALGAPVSPEAPSARPTSEPDAKPEPSPHATDERSSTLPWVLVIGGGAALGVGTVLGLIALDHSAPDASDEQADGARGLALATDLSLGVGLLATGIGLWLLLDDDEPERARAQVAPLLDRDRVGVHAQGRF